MLVFQSAPPCGERPSPQHTPHRRIRFNPRPPAESDSRARCQRSARDVSIRAPLRRATRRTRVPADRTCSFNPRPPAESDPHRPRQYSAGWNVSIRAPLRRATPGSRLGDAELPFQSAPPCGERRAILAGEGEAWPFQSAPPCGERRSPYLLSGLRCGFNPRPPAESDFHRPQNVCGATVSIRAPLRRATRSRHPGSPRRSFNPRPPAESDLRQLHQRHYRMVSIRAPLRRATKMPSCRFGTGTFQSAPPCGERRAEAWFFDAECRFNPRPPAESDP